MEASAGIIHANVMYFDDQYQVLENQWSGNVDDTDDALYTGVRSVGRDLEGPATVSIGDISVVVRDKLCRRISRTTVRES